MKIFTQFCLISIFQLVNHLLYGNYNNYHLTKRCSALLVLSCSVLFRCANILIVYFKVKSSTATCGRAFHYFENMFLLLLIYTTYLSFTDYVIILKDKFTGVLILQKSLSV